MATIALTTRLSRAAVRMLRARAERVSLGTSAYASRLLESVLLGREPASIGRVRTPRRVEQRVAEEVFFVALALKKILEKQPELVSRLRQQAREAVAELFSEEKQRDD